jgi:hypothetical protein
MRLSAFTFIASLVLASALKPHLAAAHSKERESPYIKVFLRRAQTPASGRSTRRRLASTATAGRAYTLQWQPMPPHDAQEEP